jgi:hypothetical protein
MLKPPSFAKPKCNSPAYSKFQQARTTRPEISIHVNLLGRCTIAPSTRNLVTAKDICLYLLSIKSEGLHLNPIKDSRLEGKIEIYVDTSYRGEEARSQTGVIAMVANQPVTWYSRRQDTVLLSITKAEYITCSEGERCELDSTIPE